MNDNNCLEADICLSDTTVKESIRQTNLAILLISCAEGEKDNSCPVWQWHNYSATSCSKS